MRETDRADPALIEAERGRDGSYRVAPKPPRWREFEAWEILVIGVMAVGTLWPVVSFGISLIGG